MMLWLIAGFGSVITLLLFYICYLQDAQLRGFSILISEISKLKATPSVYIPDSLIEDLETWAEYQAGKIADRKAVFGE